MFIIIERHPDPTKAYIVLNEITEEVLTFSSRTEAETSDQYGQCQDPLVVEI
jgi:hypothetical protein